VNKKLRAAVAIIACGTGICGASSAWADDHSDSYPKLVEQIGSFDAKQRAGLEALVKACYQVDRTTLRTCQAEIKGWAALHSTGQSSTVDQYVSVMRTSLSAYEMSAMAGLAENTASALSGAQKYAANLRDGLRDTEKKGFFSSLFK
jgi:hypothetical protein